MNTFLQNIPSNSLFLMITILVLLAISTMICALMIKKNPQKDFTELRLRISSWWWIILFIYLILLIPQPYNIFGFAFISFMALKEFLSIVPMRLTDRRVIFWAYLSIPLQYYWVYLGWYGMFIIFIPVYVFLFLPIVMVIIGETKGFIRSAGTIHWSVMLTVFCISHVAYLLNLGSINAFAGNIGLVLFLLVMTQFNDVCQYLWGKSLGKHKITPKVSPNKTWEGFLGGVFTITLLSTLIAPFFTPLNVWQSSLAGFIIAISGFFGDLVISAVKRDLNIKDTGSFIPGHGGILDRLDSLIFSAPIFFHYIYYIHN